jgi:TonB family protein
MTQKIKIMKPAPELTDDEIVGYMDFGSVLQKRNQSHLKRMVVKWSVGVLLSAAVLVASIYFVQSVQDDGSTRSDSSTPERQNAGAVVEADSGEIKADSAQVPLSEENAIAPAKDAGPPSSSKKSNPSGETTSRKKNPPITEKPSENPVNEDVYIQAEPVDGYEALYAYLSSNLSYPQEAMKDSLQGAVTVTFIISAEGLPDNIQVKKNIGEAFSAEVTRVIRDMPPWNPATLNGKAVPSRITLPLTFHIEKIKN